MGKVMHLKKHVPSPRQWYRNLSLRKALFTIIFLTIAIVVIAYAILVSVLESIHHEIFSDASSVTRIETEDYPVYMPDGSITIAYSQTPVAELHFRSSFQQFIFEFTGSTITMLLLPLVLSLAGIISAASIFYRTKLKAPLGALEEGARRIADNDLDFEINYPNGDEMGRLCNSFEEMRIQLDENNRSMWRMVEERKQLNAAAAHDLRTPITVIKGYTEFLQKNIPKGKVNQEKLMETLTHLSDSTIRLERYAASVVDFQKMEEMEIHAQPILLSEFTSEVSDSFQILAQKSGKQFATESQCASTSFCFDSGIVFRVLENLVGNAMRYAQSQVKMTVRQDAESLSFIISDDGPGFSPESLEKAFRPFYMDGAGGQMGLGLSICKILCEKHGGTVRLANEQNGGGMAEAIFGIHTSQL